MAKDDSDARIDTVNILIGELAVKEKLITLDQLRFALAEQVREIDPHGSPTRSLAQVFVGLGFVTPTQMAPLLNRLHERTRNPSTAFRERSLLGQILVRSRQMTVDQVADCLRLQRDLQDDGRGLVPRIGELFIRQGYASPAQVLEALQAQERVRAVGA